jgi:hypothetical protein
MSGAMRTWPKSRRLFVRMIGREVERDIRIYLLETAELDRFIARLRVTGRTGVLVWRGDYVSRVGVSRRVDPAERVEVGQ